MIAIINKETTHYIISCNTNYNEEKQIHELWICRPNGKNLKIKESNQEEEIRTIKEAIDYGIENGEKAVRFDGEEESK